MRFLSGLFSPQRSGPADVAYQKAMEVSDDLLGKMRGSVIAGDVNRVLLGSLVTHRHNIPFLTSVYETIQEMDVPKANGFREPH